MVQTPAKRERAAEFIANGAAKEQDRPRRPELGGLMPEGWEAEAAPAVE